MQIKPFALMDIPRLRKLDTLRALVITCDESAKEPGKIVFYGDPAYKFMLIADGTLVVGPVSDHRLLLGAYHLRDLPIEECAAGLAPLNSMGTYGSEIFRTLKHDLRPFAAGNIDMRGYIVKWKSEGFDIKTPEELKPAIEQAIAKMFADGLLVKDEL